MKRKISAILGSLLLLASAAVASDAVRLTEAILAHQLPDGALRMDTVDRQVRIVPYFGCVAVYTVLEAVRHEPALRSRVAAAAHRFLAWYARHQQPNGIIDDYVGTLDGYRSTGDHDSTDSYAATYLMAAELLLRLDPAGLTEAETLAARRAVAGIRLTLEPDGLTWAKPTYRAKYFMDNLEVNAGLRSGIALFTALGDNTMAEELRGILRVNTAGLKKYFVADRGFYAWAITAGDAIHYSMEKYYPDILANAFAGCMVADLPSGFWQRLAGGHRQLMAGQLCARGYSAALIHRDAETAGLIRAAAERRIAEVTDLAKLRLDLLYDLLIIIIDRGDFWPRVEIR